MSTPITSPEALDSAIAAALQHRQLSDLDTATANVVRDLALLGEIPVPRPAFREELEMRLLAQTRQPATGARSLAALVLPRRRLLTASAATVGLVAVGATLWRSPTAQAQVAHLTAYIPGVGIRSADARGLVATQPVSASQGGATMTVKSLLSTGTTTTVQVEVTGLTLAPTIAPAAQPRLTLRDDKGRQYASAGMGMMTTGGRTAMFRCETTFPALDPAAHWVDVLLEGTAPLGNWQVRVPLAPLAQAGLPAAGPGASGVTMHGITVTVSSVVADRERTVVQLTTQAAPPIRFVRSLPGLGGTTPLTLRDDHGRQYPEGRATPSAFSYDSSGHFVTDANFPPFPRDAHAAALDIPFVVVEVPGEATLQVPVGGKAVGDHFPLDTTVLLGTDPLHITGADIIEEFGQRRLVLHLDGGDWHDGRKLVEPQGAFVDGHGEEIRLRTDGDVGQASWINVQLPDSAGSVVTVTLKNPLVAIAGPWRLAVPLPAGR